MSRTSPACQAATLSANKLHEIITRLASAGCGVVMIVPGYSRRELLADLRAIATMLGGRRGAGASDRSEACKRDDNPPLRPRKR